MIERQEKPENVWCHAPKKWCRQNISEKEGSVGLINVEQYVIGEGNSLGYYVANSVELLIRGVCASGTIQTGNHGGGRIQMMEGRRAQTKVNKEGKVWAII